MKGFALLVGAIAGAALLYVTTAVGGQQAGPSRAEFNALKKQVATLKKDDLAIQAVLNGCFTGSGPGLPNTATMRPSGRRLDVGLDRAGRRCDGRHAPGVSPRRRSGLRERDQHGEAQRALQGDPPRGNASLSGSSQRDRRGSNAAPVSAT